MPSITFPSADAAHPDTILKVDQPIPSNKELEFVVPIVGARKEIEKAKYAHVEIREKNVNKTQVSSGALDIREKNGDTLVLAGSVYAVPKQGPMTVSIKVHVGDAPLRTIAEFDVVYQ